MERGLVRYHPIPEILEIIKPVHEQDGSRRTSMIHLELTDDEAKVLREALDFYLSDLRMEVADTDRQDFRNRLKQEETTIKKILGALVKK
jgi:hypothetical protein